MKRKIFLLHLVIASVFLFLDCARTDNSDPIEKALASEARSSILFDNDWRFFRGDADSAQAEDFDDSSWRTVDLPHDWSIEDIPGTGSPIDSTATGGIDAGYLVGGTGWYRKEFMLPADLRGKQLLLQFDGIYMNSDIWVNGQYLSKHPYGYTSFKILVTKFLKPGRRNIIAVKVNNEGRNSRWYSGSGIYRHVWLNINDPVHSDPWQVAITTPRVDTALSLVNVKTGLITRLKQREKLVFITKLIDPYGKTAGYSESNQEVKMGDRIEIIQLIAVSKPALWSVETPNMYLAVTEIFLKDENGSKMLKDRIETPFGIREIKVSAADGFFLNGKKVLLKGGCMHHDNGPLGAAAYDRAEERRVELMKASGFNAIRCAHNPPSPAFLDACDRLGMLVIDEAFDMWREPKNPQDYHLWFEEFWRSDVESMVIRDRNHPSVVMWSIGNEVPERGKPEGAELARQITEFIRRLDPSRMVTSAVNSVTADKDPYFAAIDICGYNYALDMYVSDHKRLPERIMFGSESFPLEAFEYWMAVKDYPWVIGDFVWTGFDYLGEASIGWLGYPHEGSFFPWTHAYCGDIDICGFKRPQSYYRDVLWGDKKTVSVFVKPPVPSFPLNPKKETWSKWEWQDVVASWNWEGYEGKALTVEVYSSCSEAELLINGKSLGKKKTDRTTEWIAKWDVPYEAGNLTVKGYEGSEVVAEAGLKTAGKPVTLSLNADRSSIKADGQDLSFITVELLDNKGIRNPVSQNLVNFSVEGPGKIIAVGSSNPMGTESFQQPFRKAYQGRCLVIVKSEGVEGKIRLRATSEGLEGSEIVINVR